METENEFSFEIEPYYLVRNLIKDKNLTNKEISKITKYSYGYVSELRRRLPFEEKMKNLKLLRRQAPDLLQSLKLMVETFDKTAIDKNAVSAINVAKQSIEKAEKYI